MSLPTERYRPLILGAVYTVGLPFWRSWAPAVWFEALVMQESAGNPKAIRYERHQDQLGRRDAATDADRPDIDDGILEDDQSYGLCQVMGTNARRLCGVGPGVPMNFGFLLLPVTNVAFGLRILAGELAATSQNVARALARYNGGPTGDALVDGVNMRREVYVAGVARWAEKVSREGL